MIQRRTDFGHFRNGFCRCTQAPAAGGIRGFFVAFCFLSVTSGTLAYILKSWPFGASVISVTAVAVTDFGNFRNP